ncbi:hypothetical protein DKG71_42295 (plasmid) [Streptomyces sp. NEAU-S7GS2]|nr:hypothetical protein DKG71_42295 [Streptomyces sp. NEAU-S7GS2]
MPAANTPDLPGRRAIEVAGDTGIVTDLRVIGDARTDGTTTWCTVAADLDYWRARVSPGSSIPTRRVAIENLWIEHRLDYVPPAPGEQQQELDPGDGLALFRRMAPGAGSPAARMPVRARTAPNLHGRRIIQVTPMGFAWDLRAISEPYDRAGEITVNLCSAHDYYRWLITGQPPEPTPLGLYLLWTE